LIPCGGITTDESSQVVLEKRLGIAQLCLLLAVLVFLSVTRGSPGEFHVPPTRADAMREWGRRSLGLSGDWVSRLRSGPPALPNGENTPTPYTATAVRAPPATAPAAAANNSIATPMASRQRRPPLFLTPTHPHTHHRAPVLRSTGMVRSRTTHARSGAASPAPIPVSAPAPVPAPAPSPVRRSSSHGSGSLIGPVPRSARRWARSAHLHEVRRVHTHNNAPDADVFTASASAATMAGQGRGKGKSAPVTAVVGAFVKEAGANGRMPVSARTAVGGSLRVPQDAAAWTWTRDADAGAGIGAGAGAAETWVDTDTDAEGSDGGLWEIDVD